MRAFRTPRVTEPGFLEVIQQMLKSEEAYGCLYLGRGEARDSFEIVRGRRTEVKPRSPLIATAGTDLAGARDASVHGACGKLLKW
jgi:hypothetical protein